jgi:hypothetical protein
MRPPDEERGPADNEPSSETLTKSTAGQSDHNQVTATVVGFRSDGQPIANFRFAFKARGQARGWRGEYQFRALSESGPHYVEVDR